MLPMKTFALLVAPSLLFVSTAAQAQAHTVNVPLKSATGADAGSVSFHAEAAHQVRVDVHLVGMTPGEHAVHIHAGSTCEAPDFKSAGAHFNPTGKQHGFDNPMGHHAGDLPHNINVGADGHGEANFTVDYLSLTPGAPDAIYGHAVVVHAGADDMKSDPAGNAGGRVACGVIPANGSM